MNDAVSAHRLGDLARAKLLYEDVLGADPRQAGALGMLGLLAQQSGDLVRARALLEESVSINPTAATTNYNLAMVCSLQGDSAAAIVAYEAAVQFAPDFAEAYSNLGNVYVQSGRREDALRAYAAAIRIKPDFAPVYCNLATVLIALERYDEAIQALENAICLAPDMPEAHANLGQTYRRSRRFQEAMAPTRRALELRPDYREAYLNLALAACELNEFEVALEANQRALEIGAASAELHCNRSRVFHMVGHYTESIIAAEAAIALRPDYPEAHVNLALSLLISGDFARGWDEYVWMWRIPSRRAAYPYLDRVPLWSGESFGGKKLLITRDQGFGDALHMARYFPAVKARGGRVLLEVLPALAPLFTGMPGVDEMRIAGDETVVADDIDLQVPLLGLPRAFATDIGSIPAPIPYVRAPGSRVERWRPRLECAARRRVGIVWSGYPGHANDHQRSVRLEDFAPLGAIDGIAWFGLQKGREEERRSCGPLTLDPLGAEIGDFADTAAILTQLDLIIAVDTAIVHLAGAMGSSVWTLLPFAPDWRWMIERSDSPWYPTMRLFRQPRPGDWASVFTEVGRALLAWSFA